MQINHSQALPPAQQPPGPSLLFAALSPDVSPPEKHEDFTGPLLISQLNAPSSLLALPESQAPSPFRSGLLFSCPGF